MNSKDYITDGTWQKREEIKLNMMEKAIDAFGFNEGEFTIVMSDKFPGREFLFYGEIEIGELPNNEELQNV